jgi:hypothetical protein
MSQTKKSGDASNVATRAAPMSAASAGSDSASHKPQGVPRTQPAGTGRPKNEDRFWLEAAVVHMSRWLGSLQVAVLLLIVFAAVLAIGTVVESWYSDRIAKQLVYRTWWFVLLLALLAINIFCAAAKKWPWKKYQTGFIITHIGLLTMLAGGAVTWFTGTDAEMQLIASDDPVIRGNIGLPQSSNRAILRDDQSIRVRRITAEGHQKPVEFPFDAGPLAWRSDEYLQTKTDALLGTLNFLAHPLPRDFEADLGNNARLKIVAYYPHVRTEKFSPADENHRNFPAVKIQLRSPMFGGRMLLDPWLAMNLPARNTDHDDDPGFHQGAAMAEFAGKVSPSLLNEFLKPPPANPEGEGELVVRLDGETGRFPVAESRGKQKPLGKMGNKLKVTKYVPSLTDPESSLPTNPLVEFELTTPEGKSTTYACLGRYNGVAIAIKDGKPTSDDPNQLQIWYHVPDNRFGADARGVLQFAVGTDNTLYYRSFTSSGGPFRFESSGVADPDKGFYSIWEGMNWEFKVLEYLPNAYRKDRYVPVDARPGLQTERLSPALRCRLINGDKQSDEFWLLQSGKAVPVKFGNETFEFSYGVKTQPLDFDIKLLRAEQEKDAGTTQAATYTSYVQLNDPGDSGGATLPGFLRGLANTVGMAVGSPKIVDRDCVITMNHPLDHRGFKLYQSTYRFVTWDSNGKPVSLSGFTIGRDPGLLLKYLGSSMLALGIACMFYMKAYFFKPRRRPAPAA